MMNYEALYQRICNREVFSIKGSVLLEQDGRLFRAKTAGGHFVGEWRVCCSTENCTARLKVVRDGGGNEISRTMTNGHQPHCIEAITAKEILFRKAKDEYTERATILRTNNTGNTQPKSLYDDVKAALYHGMAEVALQFPRHESMVRTAQRGARNLHGPCPSTWEAFDNIPDDILHYESDGTNNLLGFVDYEVPIGATGRDNAYKLVHLATIDDLNKLFDLPVVFVDGTFEVIRL